MGRGNVCVSGEYEGLYYIDNDYLDEYCRVDEETGEEEYRLLGELSYEDLTGGDWKLDEWLSRQNWEDTKRNLTCSLMAMFPSFTRCDKWIERDRFALLENSLFYIAVADNEWSQAIMLIQKDHWCYDFLCKYSVQGGWEDTPFGEQHTDAAYCLLEGLPLWSMRQDGETAMTCEYFARDDKFYYERNEEDVRKQIEADFPF